MRDAEINRFKEDKEFDKTALRSLEMPGTPFTRKHDGRIVGVHVNVG